MPIYAIVNSDKQEVSPIDVPDYRDALAIAGLKSGEVDFATMTVLPDGSSFTIIVYEFGLIKPKQTTYFRLARSLYNGNAVIYKANEEGDTIDFPNSIIEHWKVCPEFEWLKDIDAAEEAIQSGRANRPQSAINGQVCWQWNLEG